MSCKNCNTNCVERGSDGQMCMSWTKKPMSNARNEEKEYDKQSEIFPGFWEETSGK